MSTEHRTDPIDGSSVGEVAWLDPAGRPRAAGVLPLVLDGRPVVALTFDRADLATNLAGAEVVDLLVREPRNTSTAWRPAAWRCRTRLVEDLEGEVWLEHLRLQELRRYPPARRYADSLLLCREHWWYLPRLLVELEPTEGLDPPPPRRGSEDLLLVTAADGLPRAGGVRSTGGALRPAWGRPPSPGPALLLGQDATFPDLEVWECWTCPAEVGEGEIIAHQPVPDAGLRIPGLRERWRREREFARTCRRGLAAWTG